MIMKFNTYNSLKENNTEDNQINKKIFEPTDIFINVENKQDNLINKLIDELSIVIKKRTPKAIRILKIEGYINKDNISNLKLNMSNGDVIEGKLITDNIPNILIKINDVILFDLEHKLFNIEVLIDKIINMYKKHIESKKFIIK